MMKNTGSYYTIVIEDISTEKVISSATLVVEQKFIHNCALVCFLLYIFFVKWNFYILETNKLLQRGRLEDVVVNNKYRGKHLGKLVVKIILQLSYNLRCYKLSLDCKDHLIAFYESLGFKREPSNANYLNMRFSI